MSREAKRVPLNFGWPLKTVWEGYLTPEWLREEECTACGGEGYSPRARQLRDLWYGAIPFKPEDNGSAPLESNHPAVMTLAVRNYDRAPDYYGVRGGIYVEAERLADLFNSQWQYHINEEDLTAINAQRDSGITDPNEYVSRSIVDSVFGDSIGWYACIKARCEKEGVSLECSWCNGHGTCEKWKGQRATAEVEWQRIEPPEGPGWQLWEDTTDGSPVSPVFESAEDLAKWCEKNATVFGSATASEDHWLKIIRGEELAAVEISPNVFVM